MKRYISRILLFFCLLAVIDRVAGVAFDYLSAHVPGGFNREHYYAFNECRADLVVLGSSRARHHYNVRMMQDSLGMDSYNCGYDALGILNMYGRYRMIRKRHIPRIVIYDAMANNECYLNDNRADVDGLKQYCDTAEIAAILNDVEPNDKWKLMSRMYRYNSKMFMILSDYLHPDNGIIQGFNPLDGTMNYDVPPYKPEFTGVAPDTLKLKYLRKLITDTRRDGTLLVVCFSPWYGATTDADNRVIKQACRENGVPVLDHFTDRRFVTNKRYFKDTTHLNREGADIYTRIIIGEIRKLYD